MPLGSSDLNAQSFAQQMPASRVDPRQEQRDSLQEPSRGDNYRIGRMAVQRARRELPRLTRRGLSR